MAESPTVRAKRLADESRGIMISDSMSVACCPDCACGQVFLRLHRSDGSVFALAPMTADTADAFCFDLAEVANKARAVAGQAVRAN